MKDDYKFKIRGLDGVMTYEQLMEMGRRVHPRCIKIIDVKQKQTWVSDYLTIKEKFG